MVKLQSVRSKGKREELFCPKAGPKVHGDSGTIPPQLPLVLGQQWGELFYQLTVLNTWPGSSKYQEWGTEIFLEPTPQFIFFVPICARCPDYMSLLQPRLCSLGF